MNTNSYTNIEPVEIADRPAVTTRRAVLTAGGIVALGSLAGCTTVDGLVDRAGEQVVGTTAALPAGFYDGSASTSAGGGGGRIALHRSDPIDVRYVPPSLQAASQEIEIDGWSTSAPTKAQDYNSSRSNKPSTIWWPGPDDDDDTDADNDTGVLVTVLDIERALLVYADAAIAAVDDRASDDAKVALDAFINATTTVRAELDGCPSEPCVTVAENADSRHGLAQDASDAVDAGEWDSAKRHLQEARRIVQGDIDRIFDDLDSDDDGVVDEAEPLYEYLDGEPTIGERFVVSLPDARVRGDGPALAEELTPQRVLEYFIGERDAERCGESDRSVAIHRDLACRTLLTAALTLGADVGLTQLRDIDKKDIRRGVAAFETDGGIVVTGASPAAEVTKPMLLVSEDGSARVPEDLRSWGEETTAGNAAVTATFVVPVAATPPGCPSPMPALLYMRRIRHEEQLLYVGGWVIDDGALYEDAATLLVGDGPTVVAGVSRSDIEEGGVDLRSRVTGRKKPGRTTYGNMTLSAPYDPNAEYLPAGAHSVCRDDGHVYCWGVQSRESFANHPSDCDDRDSDVTPSSVVTALDAPVLHLSGVADASNEVKFKAGAELSKAVN